MNGEVPTPSTFGSDEERSEGELSWLAARLARRVRSAARDLDALSTQLGETDLAAGAVKAGASLTDRVGRYLERLDPATALADLERLARQRPLETASTALLIGFSLGRILRASAGPAPARDVPSPSTNHG